jgi:hypothetical protein
MIKHPKYNKGSIYLSGAMERATDGQLGSLWRKKCSDELMKLGYYPVDISQLDMEYAKQHGDLFSLYHEKNILQRKSNIRAHFIEADLKLILNQCNAVLLYYDEGVRQGAGTISEAQIAYTNEIPVFIVNGYDSEKEIPGWLYALSTKIFSSFEEAYQYFTLLPDNILQLDKYGNRHCSGHYLCSLCGSVFEKHKHHFVSKVSPLLCMSCVDIVKKTHESLKDRYEFFCEQLEKK